MARDTSDYKRRERLQAALKKSKPDDFLELETLAQIWGTTKQRFVTVRNEMIDFPGHMKGEGNKYVYPARVALASMLAYETKADSATKQKQARVNRLLGRSKATSPAASHMSANEMATYARMSAEIEEREREQGQYIHIDEVARVAGEVFTEISDSIRGLPNKLDPHGLLGPEERGKIEKLGNDLLLRIHAKMRDVMSRDAKPRRNRKAPRRPR